MVPSSALLMMPSPTRHTSMTQDIAQKPAASSANINQLSKSAGIAQKIKSMEKTSRDPTACSKNICSAPLDAL